MDEAKLFNLQAFRAIPLPTEQEIMATWQGSLEQPVVSVLCNTYNQRPYIEDAFRGFLIQKTDFPFEVIVHDDASTDGTTDIVRDYAARYPKIIRPLIQTENQYSNGKKPTLLSFPYSKGEYIALCEGDDFWINPNKLKIQLNALLKKPDINICFHKNFQGNTDSGKTLFKESLRSKYLYPKYCKIVSTSTIILGDGGYMPTASLMFKREVLKNMPKWFNDSPVGDYFIQIIASHPAGAIFLPKKMSFYRKFSIGSWSNKKKKPKKDLEFTTKMLNTLIMLDNQLFGTYKNLIKTMSVKFEHNFFSRKENRSYVNRNKKLSNNIKNITINRYIKLKIIYYIINIKRYVILLRYQ